MHHRELQANKLNIFWIDLVLIRLFICIGCFIGYVVLLIPIYFALSKKEKKERPLIAFMSRLLVDKTRTCQQIGVYKTPVHAQYNQSAHYVPREREREREISQLILVHHPRNQCSQIYKQLFVHIMINQIIQILSFTQKQEQIPSIFQSISTPR